MSFGKKSQDPWDRKPERPAVKIPTEPSDRETPQEPSAPKRGPLDSLRNWNERRKAEKEETHRLPPEPCPWCGRDMEQGYLYTGRDKIYWSPGWMNSATAFLGPIFTGGMQINDEERWASCKTTWLCRECRKFVFTMPEDFPSLPETDEELREEDS